MRLSEPVRANLRRLDSTTRDAAFEDSDDAAAYACRYLGETTTIVAQHIGDKNILPYMHLILGYLFGLAFIPNALLYVEGFVLWEAITIFLNTLGRSGVVESRFESEDFPQQLSGTGRQLPEDFVTRGLIWAQNYFPNQFSGGQIVDEDERNLELPSHAAPRAERCLWLGVRLASVSYRQIRYGPVANFYHSSTDGYATIAKQSYSRSHNLRDRLRACKHICETHVRRRYRRSERLTPT
jgi:hypothetical protein